MTASAEWLHNMSVPPTSTIIVAREPIDGLRFALTASATWAGANCSRGGRRTGPAAPPLAWAARLGPRGWLALLEHEVAPWTFDAAAAGRSARGREGASAESMLAAFEAHAVAAGLPGRSGVFVSADPEDPLDHALSFGATLAVLARRSGPLYLPRRRPQLSLIVPFTGTLIFPEA